MTEIETLSQPALAEGPMPITEYRALSVWAIAALVLGLLSGVAIAAPLLAVVPLVAMVVGGIALRRIALHSDRLSGRWMAVVPFLVAPLFLGWGFAREFSRRERLFTHSREFADEWLSILNRNQLHFAHQLKVQAKNRMDASTDLEVGYRQDEVANDNLKLFRESSPIREILAAAPQAKFQFEEYLRHEQEGFSDNVTLQYSYETPASGKSKCWIIVKRTYSNYTGRADWQIVEATSTKPHGI